MVVNIRFVGSFRSLSNKDKFSLEISSPSLLKEVVKAIIREAPALESVLLPSNSESLKTNALVLVNGKEVSVLDGWDTRILDGDEVVFVPVLHGG